jgi:O-antigen ligase
MLNWRFLPVQAGVLATFALVPVWYRFSVKAPPPFGLTDSLYVSYFLILLSMLWTIGAWLLLGLPGFAAFLRDRRRVWWALALLLLALWALLSPGWAFQREAHPKVAETAATQLAVVALFAVAAACAAPSARAVALVLAISLVWNGALAGLQAYRQESVGLVGLDEVPVAAAQIGASVVVAGDVRWLRAYGLMPHPNALGGFFVVGLLAAAGLLLAERRGLRLLALAVIPFGMAGLLLTFSRAAWVALAVGAFAVAPLVLARWRWTARGQLPRHLSYLLAGAALALAVGAVFFVQFRPLLAARAGSGTESVELRSVSDRLVFTSFAYRAISEAPLLGVGAGNFPWRASYYLLETDFDLRGDNVHHVLLSAFAELGVVGYGLVAIALVLGVETALRAMKASARAGAGDDWGARVGLLGAVLALVVVGLFDHYPWTMMHFGVAWWGTLAVAGSASRVLR